MLDGGHGRDGVQRPGTDSEVSSSVCKCVFLYACMCVQCMRDIERERRKRRETERQRESKREVEVFFLKVAGGLHIRVEIHRIWILQEKTDPN